MRFALAKICPKIGVATVAKAAEGRQTRRRVARKGRSGSTSRAAPRLFWGKFPRKSGSSGRVLSANEMHIQDIFKADGTTFSFEFFPPKTDQASKELFATIAQLAGACSRRSSR